MMNNYMHSSYHRFLILQLLALVIVICCTTPSTVLLVEGSTQVQVLAATATPTTSAALVEPTNKVVSIDTTAFHLDSHNNNNNNNHPLATATEPLLETVSLEGVELAGHRTIHIGPNNDNNNNQILLHRNGHGLRSFTVYGMSLKMYVASLYTTRSSSSSSSTERPPLHPHQHLGCLSTSSLDDVLTTTTQQQKNVASLGPLLFEFTFLRSVGQSKVRLAWQKQLEWSIPAEFQDYPGFAADAKQFTSMFGPMASYGSVTVQFVGNGETLILDQGQLKGSIQGENFQRAFLSMWFGAKAVQEDLKEALLAGGGCGGRVSNDNTVSATATVTA